MKNIFIPHTDHPDKKSMRLWYQNISVELTKGFLSEINKNYFSEYYREVGLLRWWRNPFFRRHFVDSFTDAAAFLLDSPVEGKILDLGCGTGTQSLLLAMSGARVVGVDMAGAALEIFQKRQDMYESKLGRKLDIEIYEGNVFDLDFAAIGPLRGIYSMFAFNLMQPSDQLLKKIAAEMVKGSRLVVIDGNSTSLVSKLLPGKKRAVWSPEEFALELKSHSINVMSHKGGVVLPPHLWRLFPHSVLSGLDKALCSNFLLPISHQVMGQK